jgi:hypothetical protein
MTTPVFVPPPFLYEAYPALESSFDPSPVYEANTASAASAPAVQQHLPFLYEASTSSAPKYHAMPQSLHSIRPPPYEIVLEEDRSSDSSQCCRFCRKWREPRTVPRDLRAELWANDCFGCRAQAGEGGLGLRISGPGVCKICHWSASGTTTICTLCLIRVRTDRIIQPSNKPLLYYCSGCKIDMFPPRKGSLSPFSRNCHICDVAELERQKSKRAQGYYDKICHICGWFAGEASGDTEMDQNEPSVCYNCEIVPRLSDSRDIESLPSSPANVSLCKWLNRSPSHPNSSAINFAAIPKRRHSFARRNYDLPKQVLDGLRRSFGR